LTSPDDNRRLSAPTARPSGPKRTVISLLIWDSVRYLDNLLRNLETFVPGEGFHLRILDQGSGAATRELLSAYQARYQHVSIDWLPENIGYSAGHNRTFESMRLGGPFDYFITINDDLVFGVPGWLDTMVRAMEATPDAAAGGPICYTPEPGLIRLSTLDEKLTGRFQFVAGTVCIIRASIVHRLGLFDESFTPAYWEDADMCTRYAHFGQRHIYIDVPLVHGYLGGAERANLAKNTELVARHGDFRARNLNFFHRRWGTPEARSSFPTDESALRLHCPRLYIPAAA
jgi:GT2 family glycosyltransferase